jgi:endogenous inhibitor of DNA gyrase (YacG/DUF329 family)
MSLGISKLFEDAESFADQRRLIPAVESLEEARQLTRIPDRRAWATYNLGAIYWHHLGNGLAARREFMAAISDFKTYGYGQRPQLKTMHANALENAMLCALSFDEFEDFTSQLNTIAPGIPILTGLVPEVQKWRERGDSWSGRLFSIAGTYYNRNDPRRDIGRYGSAKSTYHLMLTHRKELHIAREDWRMITYEFCALSMRMATDCMKVRGGDNDPNSPEEFLPILTEAIPLVDDYLNVYSGDDDIRKVRDGMGQIVDNCRQRWNEICERRESKRFNTSYQACPKCGIVHARKEISGSDYISSSTDFSIICPNCGANVRWHSGPEVVPGFGRGCLITLSLISIFAIILYLWLR